MKSKEKYGIWQGIQLPTRCNFKLVPWTLNKRDIQTVPAFLREGGDGLLSLEHHHFPQTSTVVPFEGKV
ncbi:hypothetical protein QUF95_30270 [Paenibacillus silvae]|nr:hypothetical protein [Paenibacillus silvae]